MVNEKIKEQAQNIVRQLTRAQKATLCVGKDYWSTNGLPEFDLPPLRMSDGPHGLRVQIGEADFSGIHPSLPAVCYPAACLSACSFEPDLLYEMGQALGQEAKSQGVQVLLGPGINIKRTPWCGRNFEYFSEDPLLSGTLGAAFVNGVQSQGVQCALKHFACNSQEEMRMSSNSIVDEAALQEIYLPAFKQVIEQARPAWIMSSYNLINGVYASQNQKLMDQARSWGFDGAFMTDWGGLNEVQASFENGTDLEMPGLSKGSEKRIEQSISDTRLDEMAGHLLEALLLAKEPAGETTPIDGAQTAKKVALRSMVLLKNEGEVLPLDCRQSIALIGAMAKNPRIQGAGSSKVNAIESDSLYEAFQKRNLDFAYAPGVYEDGSTDAELLEQALSCTKDKEVIVCVIGLPEMDESEGYDRRHLKLPQGHLALMAQLKKAGKPIAVLLQGGSVAELSFDADAILLGYLGGSRSGQAAADLLFGDANPCGKLAQTWVKREEDVPIRREKEQVHYKESVFCGYRYYNSALAEVAYPFGHGLSYTRFFYSDLSVTRMQSGFEVEVSLKNTGNKDGAEVAQLYIAPVEPRALLPAQQLRAFQKVDLPAGQQVRLHFELTWQDFKTYDAQSHEWVQLQGEYAIQIGTSSRHIELEHVVWMMADKPASIERPYRHLHEIQSLSDEDYEAFVSNLPPRKPLGQRPYDFNVRICDIKKNHVLYRALLDFVILQALKNEENEQTKKMLQSVIDEMPLRLLSMYGLSKNQIDGAVDFLNRHYLRGIKKLLS